MLPVRTSLEMQTHREMGQITSEGKKPGKNPHNLTPYLYVYITLENAQWRSDALGQEGQDACLVFNEL